MRAPLGALERQDLGKFAAVFEKHFNLHLLLDRRRGVYAIT
jgi:hypothetical protein